MSNKYSIDIVIPVYNEEQNIPVLCEKLLGLNIPLHKIILVNDGSSDNSLNICKELHAKNSVIEYISFSRNFGHQAALKAGYDFADADCVITMDGDMQHPVEMIEILIAKWFEGYDVVNTIRSDKEEKKLFKKYSSLYYYKLLSLVTSVDIKQGTADFRLLDKKVVDICKKLGENPIFWRGIIPWLGFKQAYIPYTPQKRLYGTSKYTLKKMINLAWSGISSFSLLPLRIATFLGLIQISLSICYILYVLFMYVVSDVEPGWSSMMIVLLLTSGFQMCFLGMLGEYVGKIFMSDKKRPQYIVELSSIDKDVHNVK